MELTYILVDFENHQPSAQDFARVRGESYRLLIFHGPQQKRFGADVVQAWQPLGEQVEFIQCPKSGRNALDMHIAYHIGLLLAEHRADGAAGDGTAAEDAPRVIVISNDTDFDPLLQYLRSLNYAANRSATIQAVIGAEPPGKGAKTKAGAPAKKAPARQPALLLDVAPRPAAKKGAATKTATAAKEPVASKRGAEKAPAKKGKTAKAPSAKASAKKASSRQPALPLEEPVAPELLEQLIEHLRTHPKNRPTKRKALEKHVASVLRRKVRADDVPALVEALARRGAIGLKESKVEYPLWPSDAD